MCSFFFFVKQKTAYEMRISDWSSDVCSSDLGENDDDESNSGRACRLAGEGDDGGLGRRGLDANGERNDRGAEHRAGLLCPFSTRAAHQGNAKPVATDRKSVV